MNNQEMTNLLRNINDNLEKIIKLFELPQPQKRNIEEDYFECRYCHQWIRVKDMEKHFKKCLERR